MRGSVCIYEGVIVPKALFRAETYSMKSGERRNLMFLRGSV